MNFYFEFLNIQINHLTQLPMINMELKWHHKSMGESMIKYTTKVGMSNCSHVFTHKCKKVELKPFQSLSNYHVAQY